MNHSNVPAFLKGVTAGQVEAAVVALAVLVVIWLLVRTLGHMTRALAKAAAPAPAPAKSGGGLKGLLFLAALGAGGWFLVTHLHATPSGAAKAAPSLPAPTPTPQPTVTRTVAPHAAPHFSLPVHLTGGQYVLIILIGAVVAIVLLGPVLRRRDS